MHLTQQACETRLNEAEPTVPARDRASYKIISASRKNLVSAFYTTRLTCFGEPPAALQLDCVAAACWRFSEIVWMICPGPFEALVTQKDVLRDIEPDIALARWCEAWTRLEVSQPGIPKISKNLRRSASCSFGDSVSTCEKALLAGQNQIRALKKPARRNRARSISGGPQ